MSSSVYIVAALLIAVISLSFAFPEPKRKPGDIGHHLVKRSLELRYGSLGDCQKASQEIYECSRTMGSNMPDTTDPQFLAKLCRQTKAFYDCGVTATRKCSDEGLQKALSKLKADGQYACASEFGAVPMY
jgi:hypothetical protein